MDRDSLHPQDQPLLDGAQRVLSAIGTNAPAIAAAAPLLLPASQPDLSTETASLPVIDRAMRVLGEVDGQLRENQ